MAQPSSISGAMAAVVQRRSPAATRQWRYRRRRANRLGAVGATTRLAANPNSKMRWPAASRIIARQRIAEQIDNRPINSAISRRTDFSNQDAGYRGPEGIWLRRCQFVVRTDSDVDSHITATQNPPAIVNSALKNPLLLAVTFISVPCPLRALLIQPCQPVLRFHPAVTDQHANRCAARHQYICCRLKRPSVDGQNARFLTPRTSCWCHSASNSAEAAKSAPALSSHSGEPRCSAIAARK